MEEGSGMLQVVVVSGETGCGKTTQLPQFILEDAIARMRGLETNIICTQPRRISAVSIANRVAEERGESVGGTVGYRIRLEGESSNLTRLLFCTSGVLLRRLVADPELAEVSHVVVDEIHERGINEDLLLIILKDLLSRRPDLKLILMSATLNADSFTDFFPGSAAFHIPGFTFPVQIKYLADALQESGVAFQAPPKKVRNLLAVSASASISKGLLICSARCSVLPVAISHLADHRYGQHAKVEMQTIHHIVTCQNGLQSTANS
jgi:HrpA-like RNA helicase